MPENKSELVYSTDKGIPRKGSSPEKVQQPSVSPPQQKVYIRIERKGRGGKSVTLIEGLRMSEKDREIFLKQLKTRLGTGGALRNEVLEIQGDHRDSIMLLLQEKGYNPKRSGG